MDTVTLNMAVPGDVNVTEDLFGTAEKPGAVAGTGAVRLTFPVNPFRLVTVTVETFIDPATTVIKTGAEERL